MITREAIVFLTESCPFPPRGSSQVREAQLIRLLSRKLRVQLICRASDRPMDVPPPGVSVELLCANGWLDDPVLETLKAGAYPGRKLWISGSALARYLPDAKALGYSVIFDSDPTEIIETSRESPRPGPGFSFPWQAKEPDFHQSDVIVTSSELAAARIARSAPSHPIHVLPHSVDSRSLGEYALACGNGLFFSGALDRSSNIEGLQWFTKEVLPRVRSHLGTATPPVVVAGSRPSRELRRLLEASRIEVISDPESTLPYLARSSVVFIPLRSGGGARQRILEAMAAGRAVVSTARGSLRLVLAPSYDIWIADRPDPFASGIVRMLEDPSYRDGIGRNAAATVRSRFDWEAAEAVLGRLLSE